ncbi:MAG: hypothetical protein K7J46_07060 [Bryobacter sp.]|jgi:hypothetical protein|nr:hypothetical protein [Bryobacter sp. CoA8 C33]
MKPLEDGLEGMIESGRLPAENSAVGAYLNANPEARQQVLDMIDISRLIRENFQLPPGEQTDIEPAPGFYARVMARIESQALPPSIWNFFLEPLGMRLVYASLALAVLLFAAAFIEPIEQQDNLIAADAPIVLTDDAPFEGAILTSDESLLPLVESTPDNDRGSALAHLTAFEQ